MTHICSFSNATVVDLEKSMRNENGVLNALKIDPRISTFDMGEHRWLPPIIKSLEGKQMIESLDEPYPWHKWKLTKNGKDAIAA